MAVIFFVFVSIFGFASGEVREATATVHSSHGNLSLGTIIFRQEGPGQNVTITGTLSNLPQPGPHGFHVHEFGDISSTDCTSAKAHWNPHRMTHGGLDAETRHIGDLGNINVGPDGTSQIYFQTTADRLPLVGPDSIVGRSLVVHQGPDDLGLGGQSDSNSTGHAGARLGCGVIGVTSDFKPATLDPGMTARQISGNSGSTAGISGFVAGNSGSSAGNSGSARKAVAVVRGFPNGVEQEFGIVYFVQENSTAPVRITGTLQNISPSNSKHGFHVHQFGSTNCTAALAHLNPDGVHHGGLNDSVRHIGDLGNIFVDEKGTASVSIQIEAEKFPLVGPSSIIGRALLLHAGEDDLGLGGFNDSLTTGHAGARLGCGVIGIASDFSPADSGSFTSGSLIKPGTLSFVAMAISKFWQYISGS